MVVTEVSAREIVTTVRFRGRNGSQLVLREHSLKRLDVSVWNYLPNDGQGVRQPLAVFKEWRHQYAARNMRLDMR